MPLYDYECPNCGMVFEELKPMDQRHTAPCPQCGGKAKMVILQAKRDWTWRIEGWWEDFDEKPVYVRDKRHLKELCKKYGVYAKCLD